MDDRNHADHVGQDHVIDEIGKAPNQSLRMSRSAIGNCSGDRSTASSVRSTETRNAAARAGFRSVYHLPASRNSASASGSSSKRGVIRRAYQTRPERRATGVPWAPLAPDGLVDARAQHSVPALTQSPPQ